MKYLKIFLIFLFVTPTFANQSHEKKLDNLFKKLKSINDITSARKIENKIWDLWTLSLIHI